MCIMRGVGITAATFATSFMILQVRVMAQDENRQSSSDAFIMSSSAWERAAACEELLHRASDDELRILKANENQTLAFRAGWESVRRTIPGTKALRAVKPNVLALYRFVGFLEGQVGMPLPQWWENALLGAQAYSRDNIVFDRLSRPHVEGAGQNQVIWQKDDDTLVGTIGEKSVRIPSDVLEVLRRNEINRRLRLIVDDEMAYLAVHADNAVPYTLACFDLKSGTLRWDADVWAAGGLVDYDGPTFHHLQLVRTGDAVYVFGGSGDSVYVEAFSCKSGENIFRFSTSY
jgi:hypothetical protein